MSGTEPGSSGSSWTWLTFMSPEIPTEIMMWAVQPMKAHLIYQSLKESIVMSYYLVPPVNHHKLTDLFSFRNCYDRLWLANQKPNTNYITSQAECLECRNSKSSRQRLHTFECECLSFHPVYGRETLIICLYSPSLCACKVLRKMWNTAKNLVGRPLIIIILCLDSSARESPSPFFLWLHY